MASLRDAMRRLQIIYDAYSPDAKEARELEAGMDEFTRLKKKVHGDAKAVRLVSQKNNISFLKVKMFE